MTSSGPLVSGADERDRPDEAVEQVDLDALTALVANVLASEGIPADAEASLTLLDPAVIAQLKVEHLDGDGMPTDVLSFPIDGAEGGIEGGGTWLVGDIVVCPVVAAEQAPGHAGNLEDELALLVIHGALHLVGWDHQDEESQSVMWDRERELMQQFHRKPSRDPWASDSSSSGVGESS
ncbi:MAG TPA: rRNA maturation RNase YbeY [Microthrixaceae bacterium]|nr:rRNA maturation RNase YbeY [Microthrixaceae bacterium]